MSALSGIAGHAPSVRPRSFRTTKFLLAALVAGLGVAAYLAVGATTKTAQATPRTASVARGVVLSSVSASGTVEAASDLSVNFETSGRVTSVDVRGTRIVPGLAPSDSDGALTRFAAHSRAPRRHSGR